MVFALTVLLLVAGVGALAFWLSRRLGESGAQTVRVLPPPRGIVSLSTGWG